MTTLQQAVQSALSSFLQNRVLSNDDIAQDVYRTVRDEAHLLLERQLICDALDSDPFELMKVQTVASPPSSSNDNDEGGESDGNGDEEFDNNEVQADKEEEDDDMMEKQKNTEVITRIKSMLRVISCNRTTTLTGYTSIQAVVQLTNDGKLGCGVKDHVRLHFSFLREPQPLQHHRRDEKGDGNMEEEEEEIEEEKGGCSSHDNTNGVKTLEQQPSKKRKLLPSGDDTAKKASVAPNKDDDNDESSNDDTTSKEGTGAAPKTIITYKIDYSVDHGPMEQLLGVDIYALGDHPSVEEAIPMVGDEDDDDSEEEDDQSEGGNVEDEEVDVDMDNDNDQEEKCGDSGKKQCCVDMTCSSNKQSNKEKKTKTKETTKKLSEESGFEEIVMSDDHSQHSTDSHQQQCDNGDDDMADRFGVFINPENVVKFLDKVNMNFNEQSVFYFLLTFPFYEHEWDVCGFLLTALFDDDDDDEMEDEEDEDGGKGGDAAAMMNACNEDCDGEQPCCAPCK